MYIVGVKYFRFNWHFKNVLKETTLWLSIEMKGYCVSKPWKQHWNIFDISDANICGWRNDHNSIYILLQRNSKMLFRTWERKTPTSWRRSCAIFCQRGTCKAIAFLHAKWLQAKAGEIAKILRIDVTKFKAERGSYDHFTERTAIKTSKVLSKAACRC